MGQLVFMDESGYATDWVKSIDDQPFYVLSSVIVDFDLIPQAYDDLRSEIEQIGVDQPADALGKGTEIKGSAVAKGSGWWRHHNNERNAVREAFLSFPRNHSGCAILVVVDKHAHLKQYSEPEDPSLLALRFALERIERVLEERDDHAVIIYDQNKRIELPLYKTSADLVRDGSQITYFSSYWGDEVQYTYSLNRVQEMTLCNSKNSLGIQVADFFATCAYQHFKANQPQTCGWWDVLESSLHRKSGQVKGYGLKVFP